MKANVYYVDDMGDADVEVVEGDTEDELRALAWEFLGEHGYILERFEIIEA